MERFQDDKKKVYYAYSREISQDDAVKKTAKFWKVSARALAVAYGVIERTDDPNDATLYINSEQEPKKKGEKVWVVYKA